MSKKLMVIGAGISQLPTFRAARKLKVETIAVDGNPNAPFRNEATYFECLDFKNIEATIEIGKKYKIDGVVVPGTDFPVVGARVAEELNLHSIPLNVAEICSDKTKQRKFLQDMGYNVPNFVELEYTDNFNKPGGLTYLLDRLYKEFNKKGIKDLHGGLVVKPIDSMAARGVRFVNSDFELKSAVKEAAKFSRSKKVIVEKFISGLELSIDALVYEGEIYTFANADRHFTLFPYFIEIGHTMPTILNKELADEARITFEKAVNDLGIINGAAKGDIKVTENGIVIGEIAARISGGFLSGWTTPNSTGIYPHEDLIRIALGEKPKFEKGVDNGYSAERVILSIPGKLKSINNIKSSMNTMVHLHVKEGEDLHFPTNNAQRCGSAITFSKDRNLAIYLAQRAVKETFLRLEPNNQETENFLNSNFVMFKPSSKETDWHEMDIEQALSKVYDYTHKKNFEKVKNFWRYFYTGGVQGGVYCIDTFG